jgi:short-subunit dehydrogenase
MSILDASTVVITGASSGLGAEFARQLAPRARCLILSARRADRLAAIAKEIARNGLTVHCLTVDLASAPDTARFLEEVRALGEPINVLINNAGLGDHGLFEDGEWAKIEAMLDVNVKALTQVTHALLKDLVARGRGAILNVSSIASLMPLPQMAVYAATKAYVTNFTEALRAELRGTGVSVLALCAGPMDTEFAGIAHRPDSNGAALAAPPRMKVTAPQAVREGLAALEKGRARVIPGRIVRAVMTAANLAPMWVKRIFLNQRGRGYTGH